ncbi:MAG: aminotransferase class I/II-fold pyridoxal phosphate-dependent enzyme [Cyclobacteriaceae bacterium]
MAKSRTNKFIDTIDECLTNGVNNGIFQVSLENETFNGRNVTIDGKSVVNFGSCSYLGLEVDERLKQGAIDATMRYGTQYSSSRLFSACNLYDEVEDLFSKIFGHPSILAATTTLTHLGALPILVQDDDLIILDHQVHGSVQLAVQVVKARGTKVEMIKHNNMNMLEDLIKENPNKYNKIWYMADGLYSMYGDFAPLKEITALLEKYGNFHVYIDDAHGMSWAGKHGCGYVLGQMPLHPKMVLSTSLAKGFGTGGGVTVLTDKEMRRKIVTCGSSYTFSGPVQPPMIGASIASAKIHLSDEIYTLQKNLSERIELTRSIIDQYELPLVLPSSSPIFYIGLGLPRVGYNMVKRLLGEGFYTNIGIFPGVPVKCCGLRLAVTNGQTKEDIKNVLDAFHHHFPKVLEEEGQTVEDISNNFNLPFEETKKRYSIVNEAKAESIFDIQHETTIHNIDKELWDELLGDNGTFDWEGCRFIEETFRDNPEPENNWNLHYLIIRDTDKKPILATFFTELLCKDDMIAPASVSQQIEDIRKIDKYYLTSKVVMMGSLMSLGEHLYVDRKNHQWKNALLEMIQIMNEEKLVAGASMILLRDFDTDDVELRDFFTEEGFLRADMFNEHMIENLNWSNDEEFLNSLSRKSRVHQRKYILPNQKLFNVKVSSEVKPDNIDRLINLYRQVKDKGFEMNTFQLPIKFFENLYKFKSWEIIELSLEGDDQALVYGMCYKSPSKNYIPMIIGLDYQTNAEFGSYRQMLFQAVKRANSLNFKKVFFGFGADTEKHKFGSQIKKRSVYIQADDNFSMESLNTFQQVNHLV